MTGSGMRVGVVLAAGVLLSLAMACVPASEVRRSALIPAANLPARVGEPLGEGQVRGLFEVGAVELGSTQPLRLEQVVVTAGTAGVFVPNLHLGGSMYYGVNDVLEVGGRLQFTKVDWADANVIGVLPFPRRENGNLWSAGPGLRANFPLSPEGPLALYLSLLAELNYTDVPQAVYRCTNCGALSGGELPLYELDRFEREAFWLPNVGLQFGAYTSEWSYVGLVFGGQSSVANSGFDDDLDRLEDSSLETFFVGYLGGGADFIVEPLVAGLWVYYPFGGRDEIDFGVRATFQLGVTFGRPSFD